MKNKNKALSIAGIGAFFYFYQFFVRGSAGVLMEFLMKDFNVDAAMFGWFAAAYYWTYSPSQIPIGILLDNWGPKKVLLSGSILCVLGIFLLSFADSFYLAIISRLLVGIGASTAFIGQARMSTLWFPPATVGFIIGIVSAMGVIGGAISSVGLPYMVSLFPSWKTSFTLLGIIGLSVIFCIWKFMDDGPKFHSTTKREPIIQQVLTVLKSSKVLLLGIYGYATYLSISVFSDTWSPIFIKSMYGFSIEKASSLKSFVLIGSCIGCPFFSYLSNVIKKRVPILYISAVGTFIVMAAITFIKFNSEFMLSSMLFLLGFISAGEILVFPIGIELMPSRLSGTVTAIINMFIMFGGMFHTPLIGIIVDACKTNAQDIYNITAYQTAFSTILFALVISFITVFFIPETFPKDNK